MTSIHTIPSSAPTDIILWADTCGIKVDGHSFDSTRFPQLIEPLRAQANHQIRHSTLVKPVQSGGSTVGEVTAAFWCAFYFGLLQYNWQDDLRAEERWATRILKMLRSVPALKWAGDRYDEKIGNANFVNSMLLVQGVVSKGALDSETVPMQINEELHLWGPGQLDKARRRQTLVWNKKSLDISNAGIVGDQLEAAYEEGSMDVWESFCPGCKQFHPMRFRWNEKKPELGGLRFDTAAGRQESGKYNLSKLVPTIRYQMPCGFIVRDTPPERRALTGKYRQTNPSALDYKKSWIYDAVSVSEINWSELTFEWLRAIRAKKNGDIEPLKKFVQERECQFWNPAIHIPFSGTTLYNVSLKNRNAMPGAVYRGAKFDWQAGYKAKGELEHYWGVILDVDINANSQLIWEGKCQSDAELLAELEAHSCPHKNSWIDCTGVQKKRHLQFCYQNGLNAISLDQSRQQGFLHADKVRRFYSEGKPIYKELNTIPAHDPVWIRDEKGNAVESPNPDEPVVVELHKAGMLAFYFFIRNMKANVLKENPKATEADYIRIDIPDDVSDDFKAMMESWEMVPGHRGAAKDESVDGFKPRSRFDHQLMNMAYHCFDLEWNLRPDTGLSLVGERLAALGLPSVGEKTTQETK
jgi:thiol-disulfide isomerase/thioredoxin